jgi:hypothetical protein
MVAQSRAAVLSTRVCRGSQLSRLAVLLTLLAVGTVGTAGAAWAADSPTPAHVASTTPPTATIPVVPRSGPRPPLFRPLVQLVGDVLAKVCLAVTLVSPGRDSESPPASASSRERSSSWGGGFLPGSRH